MFTIPQGSIRRLERSIAALAGEYEDNRLSHAEDEAPVLPPGMTVMDALCCDLTALAREKQKDAA